MVAIELRSKLRWVFWQRHRKSQFTVPDPGVVSAKITHMGKVVRKRSKYHFIHFQSVAYRLAVCPKLYVTQPLG